MRRFLIALGGAVVLAVLAAATIPFWMGWALRPVARLTGASFSGYERIGYGRFALTGAVYVRKQVRVTAARAEADTPILWLWKHFRGRESPIRADDWSVVTGRSSDSPVRPEAGMVDLHERLTRRILPRVAQWVPLAHLGKGSVRWPTGGFTLEAAEWSAAGLRVTGLAWPAGRTDLDASWSPGTIEVKARQPAPDLGLKVTWKGSDVTGELLAWSQPVALRAHYPPAGWLPEEAEARAEGWDASADRVGLGSDYGALTGRGHALWTKGAFQVAVEAEARPKPGMNAPAITLKAAAAGDRRQWSVSELEASLPSTRVRLEGPVSFGYGAAAKRFTPARLSFDGRAPELSRVLLDFLENLRFLHTGERARSAGVLAWLPSAGTVRGSAEISAGETGGPAVRFTLGAEDLRWRGVGAPGVSASGSYRDSRLAIDSAEAHLSGDGVLEAHGSVDFKARALEAVSVQGRLGADWLARVLPEGIAASSAAFSGTASGPWDAVRHSGRATIGALRISPMQAFDVQASWEGTGPAVARATAEASAGATRLVAEASGDRAGLRLTQFHWTRQGAEIWSLEGPAELAWSPVSISNLRLRGPTGAAALDLKDGSLTVSLKNVSSAWADDLVRLPGPEWEVQTLRFTGRLDGGALVFTASADADLRLSTRTGHVSFELGGDGSGVHLTRASMVESGRVLASAAGHAGVSWSASQRPHWRVDADAPVELKADVLPGSPLWEELGRASGFTVSEPACHLRLSGTLRSPQGQLEASAARLAADPSRFQGKFPDISELTLAAHADNGSVAVESLRLKVGGQSLTASGRIPMEAEGWKRIVREHLAPDWTAAVARLDADRGDVALFASYVPQFLAARGTWSAHLALDHGAWTGHAEVHGAATRPIGSVGIVQDIHADIDLKGRSLMVRSLKATVGGQDVTLDGTVDLPAGGVPAVSLHLKGDNVPLVRKPGILVRAALDLKAATDPAGITTVAGAVTLQDSLFLEDLAALLPTGERGVSRPPPYFSVDASPFRYWRLSVEVRGDRAVRIRTAVFDGTASPHFSLVGTLGDPRAVGEVRIEGGSVIFPFVTFQTLSGAVRLAQADPYHPQITLDAVARRYGYDLRMEASGPVTSPTITFSSNPTLESEQVLFMVMAGQLPARAAALGGTATSSGQARLAAVGTYFGESLFQSLGVGGGDRLTVAPGPQMSQTGHETYTIEYKATDRWSLIGEYDEFDSYNLGVKWRVHVKGGP